MLLGTVTWPFALTVPTPVGIESNLLYVPIVSEVTYP
jgi:hypothetical protein